MKTAKFYRDFVIRNIQGNMIVSRRDIALTGWQSDRPHLIPWKCRFLIVQASELSLSVQKPKDAPMHCSDITEALRLVYVYYIYIYIYIYKDARRLRQRTRLSDGMEALGLV